MEGSWGLGLVIASVQDTCVLGTEDDACCTCSQAHTTLGLSAPSARMPTPPPPSALRKAPGPQRKAKARRRVSEDEDYEEEWVSERVTIAAYLHMCGNLGKTRLCPQLLLIDFFYGT